MNGKTLPMLAFAAAVSAGLLAAEEAPPPGVTAVFNGKDLTGWRVPAGDNGHWRVVTDKNMPPSVRAGVTPKKLADRNHGAKKDGQWSSPPALVQFRNISVKER